MAPSMVRLKAVSLKSFSNNNEFHSLVKNWTELNGEMIFFFLLMSLIHAYITSIVCKKMINV